MTKINYISFASWEDRFRESFFIDNKENEINKGYIFYLDSFYTRSQDNINKIKNDNSIELIELSFNDYVKTWKILKSTFMNLDKSYKYLINISTMPRSSMYMIFHFLDVNSIDYMTVYYNAKSHGGNNNKVITKNPLEPRLVLQHSGVADTDKKTLLVILVGYDAKRVYQLFNYFEPYHVVIGIETNNQTDPLLEENEKEFHDISNKEIIHINSFEEGNISTALETYVTPRLEDYNIILCSLGPKLSAIELYKYNLKYPKTALAYVASKDYDENYSRDINLDKYLIT
jgi:hypothetical protein